MTPEERRIQIERYRNSLGAVKLALDQIGGEGIDQAPAGEWTPRQILHHLADTELFRSVRLRILLAEDEPVIAAFDEGRFAEKLRYSRPVDQSLALVSAAMETNLQLLSGLSEADWLRAGTHEELGRFSVEDWLIRAAGHANEHASQILGYIESKD